MKPSRRTSPLTRALVLLAAPLAAAACENGITVDATVDVPPEVSALLGANGWGEVYIGGEVPKTGWVGGHIGTICGPSPRTLTFPFHWDDFGCAKRATMTAWMKPVAAGSSATACGPHQNLDIGGPFEEPAQGIAQASTVIFSGHEPGFGCTSDSATIHLTLVPTRPM